MDVKRSYDIDDTKFLIVDKKMTYFMLLEKCTDVKRVKNFDNEALECIFELYRDEKRS